MAQPVTRLADRHDMSSKMRALITGVDPAFSTYLEELFPDSFVFGGHQLDVVDRQVVHRVVRAYRPHVIIHDITADAVTSLSGGGPDVNRVLGARWAVESAERAGVGLVLLSSSAVFGDVVGAGNLGWTEWSQHEGHVGRASSLRAAEMEARRCDAVVRLASVQSSSSDCLLAEVLDSVRSGVTIRLRDDNLGSVVSPEFAAEAVRHVIDERIVGTVHVANDGFTDDLSFAKALVERFGMGADRIALDPSAVSRIGPALATHTLRASGLQLEVLDRAVQISGRQTPATAL